MLFGTLPHPDCPWSCTDVFTFRWSSVFYISLSSDIKYNNLNVESIAWTDKIIRMSHGYASTNSSNSTVMRQVQTDHLLIFINANIAKWWRRLRGACVKDDLTPARVRRPSEPCCTCRHGYPQVLHLRHHSQQRESLQYLQLAGHYHSWVCLCKAARLHSS